MPVPRSALVALLTIACDNSPRDSSPTTFDLDSPAPVATLDPAAPARWRFGGLKADPDSELNEITGITQLADGRVLLTAAHQVRLFDQGGTERWRFGSSGAGPADFGMVGWPCRLNGDTIAAFDQANNRFAFIVPEVGVVATEPADQFTVLEAACNGQGTMVISRQSVDSATGEPRTEFWTRGGPGRDPRRLATVPTPVPGTIGAGRPGAGQVGSLIYVADPNAGTITLFDQGGRRVRTLQSGGARVPVTDANIPLRVTFRPRGIGPDQEAAWWNEVRQRPRTEHWPAFGDVAPYDASHLWIFGVRQADQDTISTWVVGVDGSVDQQLLLPGPTPGYRVGVMGIVPNGIALFSTDTMGASWISVVDRPR